MKSPALPRGFSSSARIYLRPMGMLRLAEAPQDSLPVAGGPMAFTALEVSVRDEGRVQRATASISMARTWAEQQNCSEGFEKLLARLTASRAPITGFDFSKPIIMGILNVTPDSFHDGGLDADATAAIARAADMIADGAHIIDVGGESTRPGASPVPPDLELSRVLPVIQGLSGSSAISIDSRRADVLSACLKAGASLANDVHALTGPGALEAVAGLGVPVVLMHGPADPTVMQSDTAYGDVALETWDWLEERIIACERAGIVRENILVDPGVGFSKTAHQSARVIGDIALYHSLGCAIVLGASRKSFIAGVSRGGGSEDRLAGSIAAVSYALTQGVQVLRVHDVAETAQAVAVWQSFQGEPD